MAGKGSRPRLVDREKYNKNYDYIFRDKMIVNCFHCFKQFIVNKNCFPRTPTCDECLMKTHKNI